MDFKQGGPSSGPGVYPEKNTQQTTQTNNKTSQKVKNIHQKGTKKSFPGALGDTGTANKGGFL